MSPKNGWLEYEPVLLGRPIFRGELLVSGRGFGVGSRLLNHWSSWISDWLILHRVLSRQTRNITAPPTATNLLDSQVYEKDSYRLVRLTTGKPISACDDMEFPWDKVNCPTDTKHCTKQQFGRLWRRVFTMNMNIALADYMLVRASARDRDVQDQRVLIVKPAARPTLSIAIAAIPQKTKFSLPNSWEPKGDPPKGLPPKK